MTCEPLRPPPDWVTEAFKPKPWQATITPTRHGYWITFHSGLMEELATGWRPTRKSAERCARNGIARRTAEDARQAGRWTIQ